MIKKDLICVGLDCDAADEVLRRLAGMFVADGAVKESFVEAVIEREKAYPTGLPAAAFDVAIPHTVSEHVNRPAIAVAVLKKPVEFRQMGSPEITLHPRLVIMLAIKNPKEQLVLLRKTMGLLQDTELLNALVNAGSSEAVADILAPVLG